MPGSRSSDSCVLHCRGVEIDCRPETGSTHVMGILNVTPDSFSDGGRYLALDAAVDRAEEMLDEGAAFIDIGGESSRPKGAVYGEGAPALSAREECDRILPVIRELRRRRPNALVSVDTYKVETARAALEAGASMLNDITGLRENPELGDLAAEFDVPLVLMHSVGRPGSMPHKKQYADVVEEVLEDLRQSVETALSAGARQIVLDPGFGFGKSVDDNLRLVGSLDKLVDLGYPVLIGVSLKSTIGVAVSRNLQPAPISERLYGSLGATAIAIERGARIVRCHDVGPTVDMLRVIDRIRVASSGIG